MLITRTGDRFERHRGIRVDLSHPLFQVFYVYHPFLIIFSITDELLKPKSFPSFLFCSLWLYLYLIGCHLFTQWNSIYLGRKKLKPKVSTTMLNGPILFLFFFLRSEEQLRGSAGWRGEGLHIFGIWPRHLYLYGVLMKSACYKS